MDVVFKEVFIPGYGCSGLFVFVNGTMNYPEFNDRVLGLSAAQVETSHPVSIEQLVMSKIRSVREQNVGIYEKAKEGEVNGQG
ncbi:hypothetical protein [Peribacillus simplex]|uniref:hypothetical protein n=1 Tax=Peribacillus simplex TaxID=1478 RepID=UPI003D267548